MRIAVLCHYLRVAGGLSVGKNLARFLPEIGGNHEFLFFIPKGLGYEPILTGQANAHFVIVDNPNIFIRRIYDSFTMPQIINDFKADVILGAGNLGLKKPNCPQAILFHRPQLIYPLRYARMDFITSVRTWIIKKSLAACLDKTDLVFCQTPVARKRFAKTFRYPIEKISIMQNAVSEYAKVSLKDTKTPQIFTNKNTFDLFYLTKYYSHKNLEILIDLFLKYPKELESVRCIITIEPNQTSAAASLLKRIRKHSLQEKIVNVGTLEQHELAGYFCNSDALIFPTLLESFSGTYLEAMHFGVPILTSDLDFARYICEDAALYFDPWDVSDILRKILLLKSDSQLQSKLIAKGSLRISAFFKSWQTIAAETLIELENIAK